ncbi:MAG: hypothetical protein HY842_18375 [Bacteroidetes bacterium]|nr:hypothetical protein [Bacteroidota bacterium]
MDKNAASKVRELIADNKLEEALDVLINNEQHQSQERNNTLLLLKGKLAMLEEQEIAGLLDFEELARQRANISHQILKLTDGSPPDFEGTIENPEPVLIQKTIQAPAIAVPWVKYLLVATLLLVVVVAGITLAKSFGEKKSTTAHEPQPGQPGTEQPTHADEGQPNSPSSGPVKVLDFPNLQQPFNFLDFGFEFRWAEAEWISDSEIRLKIRCYITCKSNLGICYRAAMHIYADGKPIAPAEQSNAAGWVEHNAIITDDINFLLPAHAKEFQIELARDHSTWRRPFKILTH